jgi:restriction endonuclease
MKTFQFETLDYQTQAVESVVQLFQGQEAKENSFTLSNNAPSGTLFINNGIGNNICELHITKNFIFDLSSISLIS